LYIQHQSYLLLTRNKQYKHISSPVERKSLYYFKVVLSQCFPNIWAYRQIWPNQQV